MNNHFKLIQNWFYSQICKNVRPYFQCHKFGQLFKRGIHKNNLSLGICSSKIQIISAGQNSSFGVSNNERF